MNKLVVTKYNNQTLTALLKDGKCRSLRLENEEAGSRLGNIYVGKVKNVVKNIGAAFIEIESGQMGYYSLLENKDHIFADRIQTDFFSSEDSAALLNAAPPKKRQVKAGDELIVQVARDAVKTKDPVLSCYLNFAGKYSVLTLGKPLLGFSAKIKDTIWKEKVRSQLMRLKEDSFGIIVRTNAREVSIEEIKEEVLLLKNRMQELLAKSGCRTCFTLLSESEPSYVANLRDLYAKDLESIVTDDKTCFEKMRLYLKENQPEDFKKLIFHGDETLSLLKLHSLETAIKEATNRHVWLKSGGYLVIEPTEALTVIDVNTGKYTGKKNIEDTLFKINMEAAAEAARQLQLRNLSGIIIIDFIDMALSENKNALLSFLEAELSKDTVKTVLVDMTKLGLVEITRKKVFKPFHEQQEKQLEP